MKAAVFFGPRDIRVQEVPVPEIGSQEILVKVAACGICGSDLHLYKTGGFEDMGVAMGGGRVMGHEFAGVVVVGGDEVKGVAVGDRVAALAIGGFADMVKIRRAAVGQNVFPLPDGVSYQEAATLEPLAASLHAAKLADPAPGETVVILGAGIIGLGCLQVLKARYSCRVIAADLSEKRLGLAHQLGADQVVGVGGRGAADAIIEMVGEEPLAFLSYGQRAGRVDIAMDCAGSPTSTQQALTMVKRTGGKVVLVALFEKEPALDLNYVTRKGVRLLGSWAWTPEEFGEALDLVASGVIDRRPLISHCFPLDRIGDAFETQAQPEGSIKVIVQPNR